MTRKEGISISSCPRKWALAGFIVSLLSIPHDTTWEVPCQDQCESKVRNQLAILHPDVNESGIRLAVVFIDEGDCVNLLLIVGLGVAVETGGVDAFNKIPVVIEGTTNASESVKPYLHCILLSVVTRAGTEITCLVRFILVFIEVGGRSERLAHLIVACTELVRVEHPLFLERCHRRSIQ